MPSKTGKQVAADNVVALHPDQERWTRVRGEASMLPLHRANARPEQHRRTGCLAIHPLFCTCVDCRERHDPISAHERRRDLAWMTWGIAGGLLAVAMLVWANS